MALIQVSQPTVEPLTVAEARSRLGMGSEISDATVTSLLKTGRQKLEKQYGIAMINQTWQLIFDRFPGTGPYPYPLETGFRSPDYFDSRWRPDYGNQIVSFEIKIDFAPLKQDAIQSVQYIDPDGVTQTLDPSVYQLIPGDLRSSVVLTNQSAWPATAYVAGAGQVNFTAGFGPDGSSVPDTLKTAICLQVAHLRSLMAQNLFIAQQNIPGVLEQKFVVGTGSTDVIDAAISSLMQDYVRPSL